MKLKDLIGIIPDEQVVWINGDRYPGFENVGFSDLRKEVKQIYEANWGGLAIELQD